MVSFRGTGDNSDFESVSKNETSKTPPKQDKIHQSIKNVIDSLGHQNSDTPHEPIHAKIPAAAEKLDNFIPKSPEEIKEKLLDLQDKYTEKVAHLHEACCLGEKDYAHWLNHSSLPKEEMDQMQTHYDAILNLEGELKSLEKDIKSTIKQLETAVPEKNLTPWTETKFLNTEMVTTKIVNLLKAALPPAPLKLSEGSIDSSEAMNAEGLSDEERFSTDIHPDEEEELSNDDLDLQEERSKLNGDIIDFRVSCQQLKDQINAVVREGLKFEASKEDLNQVKLMLDLYSHAAEGLASKEYQLMRKVLHFNSSVEDSPVRPIRDLYKSTNVTINFIQETLTDLKKVPTRIIVMQLKEEFILEEFHELDKDYHILWAQINSRPPHTLEELHDINAQLAELSLRHAKINRDFSKLNQLKDATEEIYIDIKLQKDDLQIPLKKELEDFVLQAYADLGKF